MDDPIWRLSLVHSCFPEIESRDLRKNMNNIPKRFKNIITQDEYSKGVGYNISKLKFQSLTSILSIILLLIITFGGLLNYLTIIASSLTNSNLGGSVILGILFILISEIYSIPLSLYSTFKIEAKYGFNKTTIKIFILDFFKSLVLSIVIISIIFSLIV